MQQINLKPMVSFKYCKTNSFWSLKIMKNKLHTSKVNFRVLHNTSVPNQYEVGVNGNPQNKWTSRIYQGATPLFFGSLGRISRWNPLGTCLEFFFDPKSLYSLPAIQENSGIA